MKKILTILCTLALVAGCVAGTEPEPVYELGCPTPKAVLPAEGGTAEFTIYAAGDWSGTVDSDWLSLSGSDERSFSGSGDGSVQLSCPHNAGDTRTGTATLVCGTRTVVLTVEQRGDLSSETSVLAVLVGATSSTLTFSFGEGDSEEEMRSAPYRFALWDDADTSSLVVAHFVDAASTIWSGKPTFTFGGLESGRAYYFAAMGKDSGNCSAIVRAETEPFTCVSPADAASPAVGTVILAEDFSVIPWNGDDVLGGAGWRAAETSVFTAPSGERPEGGYGNKSFECQLFDESGFLSAADASRLAGWSVLGQDGAAANRVKMVFARAGYVKLGGYSWCAALVSPELSCIPEGMSASVRVDFTASRYSSDNQKMLVSVVEGSDEAHVFTLSERSDNARNLKNDPGWGSYSIELDRITSASRIMVGPDWQAAGTGLGKTQHRMFLSDITVTLTALKEFEPEPPAVSCVGSSSSTLTFTWTEGLGTAKDIAQPYTFSLYADSACTELVATHSTEGSASCWSSMQPRFTFGGLKPGTAYYFKVEDTATGLVSELTGAATEAFSVVEPTGTAAAGEVLLAEDFSELTYGPNPADMAAGYVPDNITDLDGLYGAGKIVSYSYATSYLFNQMESSLPGRRLDSWLMFSKSGRYVQPYAGCVRVGAEKNPARIITPALSSVPAGYKAVVELRITAAKYSESDSGYEAGVVSELSSQGGGTHFYKGITHSKTAELKVAGTAFAQYTVTLDGVTSASRISVGGTGNTSRLYVSDITVVVKELIAE